jgi:spore photoproduct lyase
MIFHGGWKNNYSTLVDSIFSAISADILYDVSIGVFRISAEYLKNMRKKRPDSAIVQYPYITEEWVSHYGDLSEEMVRYLQTLLLEHLTAEKIFLWNGGEKHENRNINRSLLRHRPYHRSQTGTGRLRSVWHRPAL